MGSRQQFLEVKPTKFKSQDNPGYENISNNGP